MKKTFIIMLLTLITSISFSQSLPLNDETKRITYEEVIKLDSMNKSELYSKALEWFAINYKSANDVIQLKDENSGKIIGIGILKIKYYARKPSISHTISIFVKDNRYKYIITDLKYSDIQNVTFDVENFPKGWAGKKKLYTTIDIEIQRLITDLKTHMDSINKDNDW